MEARAPPWHAAAMRPHCPGDHRALKELDDIQSGAPLNAFNRPNYLRHPVIETGWERVLALATLGILASALAHAALRWLGWA
jgi:hypothetical protein